MTRRLVSSMRQVMPPAFWVSAAVMLYFLPVIVTFISAIYARGFGRPSAALRDTIDFITDQGHVAQGLIVVLATLAYGVFRAVVNHPAFRAEYNQWLAMTPWRFGKPLPMGPITLGPADVIVLGILSLLWVWHVPDATPDAIFLAFMFMYLPMIALGLYMADRRGACYALLASLAVYVQVPDVDVLVTVVVVIYLAAWGMVRESLRQYPWDMRKLIERRQQMKRLVSNNIRRDDNLGWPFEAISPNDPRPMINYFDGICVSLLAGWGMYNLIDLFTDARMSAYRSDMAMPVVTLFMVLVVAGWRLCVYTNGYLPPISALGRIFTGRLIIPRYDVVLIGPGITMAAATALFGICVSLDLPIATSYGLLTAVTLGLVLNLGPWRSRWRLTGAYRQVPALTNTNKQQQEFAKL